MRRLKCVQWKKSAVYEREGTQKAFSLKAAKIMLLYKESTSSAFNTLHDEILISTKKRRYIATCVCDNVKNPSMLHFVVFYTILLSGMPFHQELISIFYITRENGDSSLTKNAHVQMTTPKTNILRVRPFFYTILITV